MKVSIALGVAILLSIHSAMAGSLQIVVDSAQWLPPHLQDSLRIKLNQYIKNFPVDIMVAVLSDSTKETAIQRVKEMSRGKNFMTVLVLPKSKDAIIIPHPAIKDTYRLQQVQEQILKPIVFAGGYYYGIYSALILLGQTPPQVDTSATTQPLSTTYASSQTQTISLKQQPTEPPLNLESLFSPRNISRAIAIIVAILVSYLSWRRWREYKNNQQKATTK